MIADFLHHPVVVNAFNKDAHFHWCEASENRPSQNQPAVQLQLQQFQTFSSTRPAPPTAKKSYGLCSCNTSPPADSKSFLFYIASIWVHRVKLCVFYPPDYCGEGKRGSWPHCPYNHSFTCSWKTLNLCHWYLEKEINLNLQQLAFGVLESIGRKNCNSCNAHCLQMAHLLKCSNTLFACRGRHLHVYTCTSKQLLQFLCFPAGGAGS